MEGKKKRNNISVYCEGKLRVEYNRESLPLSFYHANEAIYQSYYYLCGSKLYSCHIYLSLPSCHTISDAIIFQSNFNSETNLESRISLLSELSLMCLAFNDTQFHVRKPFVVLLKKGNVEYWNKKKRNVF